MDILLFAPPVQSRLELEFIALTGGISFGIDAETSANPWVTVPEEGDIPALELDSSGTSEIDLAIFAPHFSVGSQESDLAVCASLDVDGSIDVSDASLASLKVSQNLDHDGIDVSEVTSLGDYSVEEMDLITTATAVDAAVDGDQPEGEANVDEANSTREATVEVASDASVAPSSNATPIGDTGDDALASGVENDTRRDGLSNETLPSSKIDLSQLEGGNRSGDLKSDFEQIVESAAGTRTQVDAAGPSSGAHFVDVVVLARYGASNADLVNAVFAGQEHQLTL